MQWFLISLFCWIIPCNALRVSSSERPECKVFSGREAVLVNLNREFINTGMFYNWYHFASPHLAGKQLVIDIPDNEKPHLLKMTELPDEVSIMGDDSQLSSMGDLRKNPLSTNKSRVNCGWGSPCFGKMMSHRAKQLQTLLKNDCTVLQVDTDTAWVKNPFDDIAAAGDHHLIVTSDSQNGAPHGKICGCFIYANPRLLPKTFMQEWIQEIQRHPSQYDQGALNAVVNMHRKKKDPLDVQWLPIEYYASGAATHSTAHIIHANYVSSPEAKIKNLKKHKVWHESTVAWLNNLH